MHVHNNHVTWTGGTAVEYTIQIHDAQGRLLYNTIVAGANLATPGIHVAGFDGNVFITVDGGGTKQTFPVRIEKP
jgi:hypothetical protein